MKKGKLIVVCGIDGSGKTTIVNSIKQSIEGLGLPVITHHAITAGDFADVVFGHFKQEALKRYENIDRIEQAIGDYLFLNFLSRYHTVIQTNIRQGVNVVCDRYLYSHISNQKAFNVDTSLYETMLPVIQPDLTIYLKNSLETSIKRISDRENTDKIENNRILLGRIQQNLQEVLSSTPYIEVDSDQSIHSVEVEVREIIIKYLEVEAS